MPTETTDLRQRREALGLSRQKVAESAGCSVAMLQMLEDGYRPARSRALDRVEEFFATHGQHPFDPITGTADASGRQAA